MKKTIENIQKSFEAMRFDFIPDATLHYHDYIEVELIEKGAGQQAINGQNFTLSNHCVSILRPYIDSQTTVAQNTEMISHDFKFFSEKTYRIKYGALYISSGTNQGKFYLFVSANDTIIAECFYEEKLVTESIGFFAKYATKSVHISECNDFNLDFSNSKILRKNDVFATYDIASNSGVGLPKDFILDKNDLSFHAYEKSPNNDTHSFVYVFDMLTESTGYRIFTTKLICPDKEINFLITADKVIVSQLSEQTKLKGYKLCISPNLLSVETKKKLLASSEPLCMQLDDETFDNMKRTFELIIYFYKQNFRPDDTVLSLADVLFRLYFDKTLQSVNGDVFKEKVIMFFMENNHFLEDITLEDFAKYMGYDAGYASRLCIKATGYSFVKYKVYLRLQYAKHMVLSTTTPITEIAMKCGFKSQSVFNRFFKTETGYSPSKYRSLNKR